MRINGEVSFKVLTVITIEVGNSPYMDLCMLILNIIIIIYIFINRRVSYLHRYTSSISKNDR